MRGNSMNSQTIRLLLLIALSCLKTQAEKFELHVPPARMPTNPPQLPSLFSTTSGQSPSSKKDWLQERRHHQQQWQEYLGEFPKKKPPLKTQILAREELAEFTRQYV